MIRPNYRDFRRARPKVYLNKNLQHSAKGSEWEDHKYVKKIDGVYYYPVGYEDGRTIDSLSDNKKENKDDDKKSKGLAIDQIRNHFDQYLAKRGIDWRTLPKDEVDQMQRAIINQLENGKESWTSEKTVDELAKDVISGKLGSGDDRKVLLGDVYEAVQKKVDELLKSSTGSKKTSEATEESVKKATKAAEKASKVRSGISIDSVMSVYKKNK